MGLLRKPVKQLLLPFWQVVGRWSTPKDVFDTLNAEFHFDLDAAADQQNAMCAEYLTEQDDALSVPWHGRVWANPPYGRGIGQWVAKAWLESERGATVVMLLPASTDTRWFHEYAPFGDVRFLGGRLRFGDGPHTAPFASMILIFHAKHDHEWLMSKTAWQSQDDA